MTTTDAPATPPDVRHRGATTGARRTLGRVLVTLARSIAIFVPVFLVATFVTFALRSLSGLSPARIQLGEEATPEAVARVEAQWGLNRPFLVQYVDWLGGVLHGQLGTSWTNGADISTLIGLGLGVSLSVATFALLIGVVAGFTLGTVAALRRSTWVDRAITGFVTVISVMPPSSSASCWSRSSRWDCTCSRPPVTSRRRRGSAHGSPTSPSLPSP